MDKDVTDKKEKILRAALKAYTLYGVEGATTRQIAEIAGIGKSTIYEYFDSKVNLFDESFCYLTALTMTDKSKIKQLAQKDPLAALTAYLEQAEHVALHEPELLLLISQFSLGILLQTDHIENARSVYRKRMTPLMRDVTDDLREVLVLGIERKVFRPAPGIECEGLVYTICALIREMQAQAFLQDQEALSEICGIIKKTAYGLLGVE